MRSKWNGEPPYREIDFGFVFVRAVRAGEAKLCGHVRRSSLPPGLGSAAKSRLRAVWRAVFAAMRMGFKHF